MHRVGTLVPVAGSRGGGTVDRTRPCGVPSLEVVVEFEPSEQMSVMLAMIDDFMRREVIPLEGELLHGDPAVLEARLGDVQRKVREMGLWAPNFPVEHGGLGLSMVDHGLFSEALGRSPLGHRGVRHPGARCRQRRDPAPATARPPSRQRWLRPLVAGEIRSCFSMTEPETPGSNPTMLATTAVRDGDDWVIDGQKWFTSSADGAAFAIVMAVTDPEAPPHRRASMFIVPTDTPGFELVRNVSVMGHVGAGHDSHGEVAYQSCRVPARTCSAARATASRSPRSGSGPGASTTACAGWGSPTGRSRCCAIGPTSA